MSKPFPGLDERFDDESFKPTETYVLDDDELTALEEAGMTVVLEGLSETSSGHEEVEVPSDFEQGRAGAWVPEANLHLAIRQGYELYKRGQSFYFRRAPGGIKEYLLRKPYSTGK